MSTIKSEVSDWVRAHGVPLTSVTAGAGFEDLATLKNWIGGARVVGLGEATHGTREFCQLRHRMLEYLVSELGFTLLAFECNFPESLAVNRYVLTGDGDARHSLSSIHHAYFDHEETVELIEWMRHWNAGHDRKVYFYGFDHASSAPAAMFLLEYLQQREPDAYRRLRDSLLFLATDVSITDWANRSYAVREDARAAITDVVSLLADRPAHGAEEQYELGIARLHASVLSQCERMMGTNPSMVHIQGVRDRMMAENIATLLELHGPDSKAIVCAHNDHVALQPSGQWGFKHPRAGQHLRERFGKKYVTFGFAFDHGSFTALDETTQMREHSVPSVPGTLDAALAEMGLPVFALNLREIPNAVADWFEEAPASRSIGGAYYAELEEFVWTRFDMRALFDALLFVRQTTAPRRGSTVFRYPRDEPPSPRGLVNLDFCAGTEGWWMPPQPSVGAYQVGVAHENGRRILEISRSELCWPWDNSFELRQTVSAAPWRGQRVTVRCPVSMQAAHHGSSAQLALRIKKRVIPKTMEEVDVFWMDNHLWRRVATRDEHTRELSLSVQVGGNADTIAVALVMTGDGHARFGPITVEATD